MADDATENVRISTVRPGLVVTLKTSIRGNVNYAKRNLENKFEDDGTHVVEWETKKTVLDPEEYDRASKTRARARNIISMACITTPNLGLLCPKENKDNLIAAIKAARAIVREFNQTTNMTTISVSPIISEIVDNDVMAVKAISSEIADLMALMQKGIADVDVESIRKAANNALKVGGMLTPAANEKVKEAVELARKAARNIVKAGDTAANEIDRSTISAIAKKRSAFLDLEDGVELATPVVVNKRAVEMESVEAKPKKRERILSGREPTVDLPLPSAGEVVAGETPVADTPTPNKPKPARARLVDADL